MTLQPMLLNRDVLALDDCRADRAMRAGRGDHVAVSVEPKFFLSIPRSRHDPKILGRDDAEVVGDRIAEVRPIARNLFA